MSEDRDREIQELLDRAGRAAAEADAARPGAAWSDDAASVRAYRVIYEALAEEPEWELAPDFAARVAARAMPAREGFPLFEGVLLPLLMAAGAAYTGWATWPWLGKVLNGAGSAAGSVLVPALDALPLLSNPAPLALPAAAALAVGAAALVDRWMQGPEPGS